MSSTYKILSNILLSRLTPYVEEIIGHHQCGCDATSQILIKNSACVKYLRRYGNKKKQCASYLYTSKTPMVPLGGMYCKIFSLSWYPYCSRSFLVQLFLRIAGVSYGRFMACVCKLICQRIFRTVGDRQEGRDLNEKTLGADNGRQQFSANSVAYECGVSRSTEK